MKKAEADAIVKAAHARAGWAFDAYLKAMDTYGDDSIQAAARHQEWQAAVDALGTDPLARALVLVGV